MGLKDKDDEKTLKKLLDWLAAIGGVAAFLVGILTLFLDEDNAKKIAWGIAIVLAIASSIILFIQRQREKKLKIAEAIEPLSPTATLRGLLPFEDGDQLPGRGRDVQDLYTLVASSTFRFGVLWGESGCGKTSLLRAGLIPKLRDGKILPLYIHKPTKDPVEAIRLALLKEIPDTEKNSKKSLNQLLKLATPKESRFVVLFDQFEEFFLTNRTAKSRASFAKWLGDTVKNENLPVSFLIGIRGDFFAQLQSFWPHIPEPTSIRTSYQLQNFDTEQAKQIFSTAAKADGIPFEAELIQAVISELEVEDFVRPAELQVVGTRLKRKNVITQNKYEALGGARGVLSSYINEEIKQSANEQAAKLILRLMCAETVETKSPTDLSFEDILNGVRGAPAAGTARDTIYQEEIQKILTQFITARVLIRTDENKYNLAHDYLAPYVNTATEGAQTSVERANTLLKRYIAEYREDSKSRIPFRHLTTISKYASPDIKNKRMAQDVLKKSKRVLYLIIAFPILLVGALYLFLASSYYFSIDANSYVVITSGHPQLKFIPGFDKALIQTDFEEDNITANYPYSTTPLENLSALEKISGLRFSAEYIQWGGSLYSYLDTYSITQTLRLMNYQTLINSIEYWEMLPIPQISIATYSYTDHIRIYPESITFEVIQLMISRAKSDFYQVRISAVEAFSAIAQANPEYINPEIVQILVSLLEDDSYEVRASAADALGTVAQVKPSIITPEIIQTLINLLKNNDEDIQKDVIDVIGAIAPVEPEHITVEIVHILFNRCFENRNDDIRTDAANALSAVVQANPEYITPELFKELNNYAGSNNKDIRSSALIVLKAIANVQPESITPETVQILFDIYSKETDRIVKENVLDLIDVIAQENPGNITPDMSQVILDIIYKEPDENVKESVLDLLGTIAQENPDNITPDLAQTLLNNLQDNDYYIRSRTIEALYTIAIANPEGFTSNNVLFLAKCLEKEDDPNDLGNMIIILGNIAEAKPKLFTPEIVQTIIHTTEKNIYGSTGILNALGIIAQTNPESFTHETTRTLLNFYHDSMWFDDSESAANAIAAIFQVKPEGPGPQLNQMLADASYDAIIIIKAMAQSNPESVPPATIQILIGMFEDENTNIYWLPDIFLIILQSKPEQITPEMIWKLINLVTEKADSLNEVENDFILYNTDRDSLNIYYKEVISALSSASLVKPESFSTEIIQKLIEMLEDENGYSRSLAYDVFEIIVPTIPDSIIPDIVDALFTQLKNEQFSYYREQAAITLANIALKNSSQEAHIKEELVLLITESQPTHWRMAAAKCSDMITIGTMVEEAKSNPEKIEQIGSRLEILSRSKESHISYAAGLALREIEKLELEVEH